MGTIIVAVDFSKESNNYIGYAAALAKEMGNKLVLFNSYNLPIHIANTHLPASILINLEDENKKLLQGKCDWIQQNYSVEATYETGFLQEVVDELENLYRKFNADFIVMGMADKSVAQDLFGNTTTSAIMRLSFPVLAVPDGARFTGFKNVLFAYDGMEKEKFKILKKLDQLSHVFDSEVEIFHVEQSSGEGNSGDFTGESLKDAGYQYKEVQSNDVIKAIEKELKQIKADLLVMVPHKYGFWESLIHRSKTRLMASGSNVPVLSLPVSRLE